MEKLDKTIEVLCDRIKVVSENEKTSDLAELVKALADLVTARANLEMHVRFTKGSGSVANRKAILEQKDLHCLARILQGCNYMDGDMFGCCRYCMYQESCNRDAKEGKMYFTKEVTGKLQEIAHENMQ